MKKKFTLGMVVAFATVMVLSSCDRDPWDDGWHRSGVVYYDDYSYYSNRGYDQTVTYYLDGMWRGNTHCYNSWTGHTYTTSEVEFIPSSYHATSGTGYWVDYYDNYQGNYYIFNNITWQVSNGYIYVHFVEENVTVQIYDYTINDNYFDGWINDNGNDVEFTLNYITTPYYGSWDYYTVTIYSESYSKGANDKVDDETSKIQWNRGKNSK